MSELKPWRSLLHGYPDQVLMPHLDSTRYAPPYLQLAVQSQQDLRPWVPVKPDGNVPVMAAGCSYETYDGIGRRVSRPMTGVGALGQGWT